LTKYIILIRKMYKNEILNPPVIEFFLIFFTYGGLLVLLVSSFFMQWSEMASIGAFYLFLFAPFLMAILAYLHRNNRLVSKYHNWVYISGLLYFALLPAVIFIAYLVEK
jgi:hypothetical protein